MTKGVSEHKKAVLTKELAGLIVTLKKLKQISPILFEAVMANVYDDEPKPESDRRKLGNDAQ